MGGRTNLRLDDALASSHARLRAAYRRLQGYDPRRRRKPSAQTYLTLKCILKRTLSEVGPCRLKARDANCLPTQRRLGQI